MSSSSFHAPAGVRDTTKAVLHQRRDDLVRDGALERRRILVLGNEERALRVLFHARHHALLDMVGNRVPVRRPPAAFPGARSGNWRQAAREYGTAQPASAAARAGSRSGGGGDFDRHGRDRSD
jgi:hypothetical protein